MVVVMFLVAARSLTVERQQTWLEPRLSTPSHIAQMEAASLREEIASISVYTMLEQAR